MIPQYFYSRIILNIKLRKCINNCEAMRNAMLSISRLHWNAGIVSRVEMMFALYCREVFAYVTIC